MHVLSVSSVFRRMLQVLHLDLSDIDRVLHLHPRLLLSRLGVFSYYVALHLSQTAEGAWRARWMGHAMGWRHERECTLSPSIMRAGSASVPSVFLLCGMLRWDGLVGGPRRQLGVECPDASASIRLFIKFFIIDLFGYINIDNIFYTFGQT
jgi:hypothetical protein